MQEKERVRKRYIENDLISFEISNKFNREC